MATTGEPDDGSHMPQGEQATSESRPIGQPPQDATMTVAIHQAHDTEGLGDGDDSNAALKAPQVAAFDVESPAQKLEKVLKQRAADGRRARSQSRIKEPQLKPKTQHNSNGEIDASVEGAQKSPNATPTEAGDFDDFGLPIRKADVIQYSMDEADEEKSRQRSWSFRRRSTSRSDADNSRASSRASSSSRRRWSLRIGTDSAAAETNNGNTNSGGANPIETDSTKRNTDTIEEEPRTPKPLLVKTDDQAPTAAQDAGGQTATHRVDFATVHAREQSLASNTDNSLSEFSHQKLATEKPEEDKSDDGGWQTMPAFAPYDMYDDDNRLIAKEHVETEEDNYGYSGLGGAGKGYTRVLVDDDGESATSMDENTQYLFKNAAGTSMMEDEEEQRDAVSQMEATKDLLTEGQRIAYVGITRLHAYNMTKELEDFQPSKRLRKDISVAAESTKMWAQKMMIRLYAHMDISLAEQVMIEQLSEHGVQPKDLTPALLANARVKNPMAGEKSASSSGSVPKSPHTPVSPAPRPSPRIVTEVDGDDGDNVADEKAQEAGADFEEEAAEPPPPYHGVEGEELPGVRTPSQMPMTAKIDIDLRWTVLCDLFLVLIADSAYDARSRVLLERVGESLDVPWIDICKFERKVTEALEMQQQAEKENWDEKDHMESRRKLALKRRYVMMGLATVGGGLVIGLSAGLLAPVIGAGLAAGFTTIGVTGTSSFLAGAGGAAIITSSAAASGSVIGVRAADRRTGAVKTFEYRPLHNNKRVNLIVTISGWMTGKVDDVRLPFSTVDPVMGDIYSVLWEPEMLTSMGDTINILATEALTQGLQQLLGSTVLISLMAALQLPVVLTKLSYLIDNPWAVSLDRATMAGLILADSLIDRNLGTRPITLVGYSLGSRVIFACLLELARKGAYGLVQNVFMFGSPVVVKQDEYMRARSVVAGRFVNGYNRNDWILGYLFRLTNGGIRRVAGLGAVENIPNIENKDVTEFVVGHMDYRTAMPRLLRECGWLVESDEFTEIEDPDPENHAQRQRELINEIEEARKELEKEGKSSKKGGAFSFFSRKKKGEKQEWEIYEDMARQQKQSAAGKLATGKTEDVDGNNHGVLFDVDAIRAELAKEHGGKEEDLPLEQLQVRELESTLPPMKLNYSPGPSPGLSSPVPTTPKAPPRLHSPRPSMGANRHVTDPVVVYRASQEFGSTPGSEYRLSEERTPTQPKTVTLATHEAHLPMRPTGRQASPAIVNDDGITMTFDAPYDDELQPQTAKRVSSSPLLRPAFFSPTTGQSPPPPPPKDTGYTSPLAANSSSGGGLAPNNNVAYGAGAVTGVTGAVGGAVAATAVSPIVPAIVLTDPWNEADNDEGFGKEQEISMTFA